jgi:hypothetical protein
VPAAGLAHWNGVAWSALPNMPPRRAFALTMLTGDDLIAAGHDLQPFNVRQPLVARWNGANWTDLSAGLVGQPGGYVFQVAFAGEGLFVSGAWDNAGGATSRASP